VATGCDDGYARIWDATTGLAVSPPLAHSGSVRLVRFTADDSRLITADDHSVWVWQIDGHLEDSEAISRATVALAGRYIDENGVMQFGDTVRLLRRSVYGETIGVRRIKLSDEVAAGAFFHQAKVEQRADWHRRQADTCSAAGLTKAAEFHRQQVRELEGRRYDFGKAE
jgi:hypothetical protein